MHLYVNNLPYGWTDNQLHRVFSPFGSVTNATVRCLLFKGTGEI
ncbi:MAG: hypothetical protein ACRC6N_01475 [Plesiomonas sp.]